MLKLLKHIEVQRITMYLVVFGRKLRLYTILINDESLSQIFRREHPDKLRDSHILRRGGKAKFDVPAIFTEKDDPLEVQQERESLGRGSMFP